jgi:serine protease Do
MDEQTEKRVAESKTSPLSSLGQRTKLLGMTFLMLTSISAGFVGGWYGAQSNKQNNSTLSQSTTQRIVSSESQLISDIAKNVGPSVVSIDVTSQAMRGGLFGYADAQQESAGTGFIVDKDVIVTNRHVVGAGTTGVSVTLSDGTKLDSVEVIGRTGASDPLDIAFLKVKDKKGKELKPLKLGDSSKMQVGDKVVAIGNALGQFQNTVTSGILSGYGRSVQASDGADGGNVESLQNLFQTDAAINQGNSGGPLVNITGEVIGINTAVAGGAQNIGFAIPINDVTGLIKGVLDTGKLQRPYLGVRYVSITDDYAYQYNLSEKRGAYIPASVNDSPSIISGSPAEKAGLHEKDIITKINDTKLDENNGLAAVLGRFSVGQKVTLTIVRDGKQQTLAVTLEAAPTS